MKIDLTDKTALVTGSTAGIGLAIAKGLAQAGAKVVVNGRKQATVDKGIAAVHEVCKAAAVSGVAADVATAEGCDALIKAAPSVDILINNAGIFEPKPFFDISDADWTRFFETNVMSGVRLSRAYLPGHDRAQLGPHHFHLIGIRREHSRRDDPLWFHQDRTAFRRPGHRAANGRHRRDGQLGAARTDTLRGCRRLSEIDGGVCGQVAG